MCWLALLLAAALVVPAPALAGGRRSSSHVSSPYRSNSSRSHYRPDVPRSSHGKMKRDPVKRPRGRA